MLSVLIADDEPGIRFGLGDALRAAGYQVTTAADGAEALRKIESQVFDVAVLDVRLPEVDGLALFRRLREESPQTDVIMITGYGEVSDAVAALKEGAHDYLQKPIDADEIAVRLARLEERRRMFRELSEARGQLASRMPDPGLIGRSPAMVRLRERLETIAASDASVLITGESGTGKELVARSLHVMSARRDSPFVVINCAAFPEQLLEAELFGHERGAFAGAQKRRRGRIQAAHLGTLLLDEVSEMPPSAQAKLLRVLQEGVVEPLGSAQPQHVDVRVLSATHRNLRDSIAKGRFREDLYYRLKVLEVQIPPLRVRRDDLAILVEHFLRRFTPAGREPPTISPGAWAALSTYRYPGNVRELAHAIEHAVVLSRGAEIKLEHLPEDIASAAGATPPRETADRFRTLSIASSEFEREYLIRALTLAQGKKTRAAELLGISRKNLWEKIRFHSITITRTSRG